VISTKALDQVEVGIAIWDETHHLSWANKAYQRFYALPESLMRSGTPLAAHLRHFASIGLFGDENLDERLHDEETKFLNRAENVLLDYRLPDGRIMEMRHAPLAEGGKVILHTDVSGFRAYEQSLADMDPITGLPSAEAGERLAGALLAEAVHAETEGLALRFQIQRLGEYESAFGIGFTNRLIKRFVQKIKTVLGEDSVFFRAGGSEFGIFSVTENAKTFGAKLSQEILDECSVPVVLKQGGSSHSIALSVGIGLACYPSDSKNLNDLRGKSRQAMLEALKDRENRARFYSGVSSTYQTKQAKEDLQLAEDLRHALIKGEFFLEYQAQIDASKNRLIGCEALLRWEHPTFGRVPPDRFIPIAEDIGLINELGKKVLVDACHQAVIWQALGFADVLMCVNVSRLQAQDPEFAGQVADALNTTGLSGKYLELELTESVLAENMDRVSENLKNLNALGIRFSIDDFGTGYSSLSQLSRLPFDRLKIDKSFVAQLATDQEALVRAVILIAESLGMEVVAEGVETGDEAQALRALGCHTMQGFHFSKTLSADDFVTFCKARFDVGGVA